MTRKIDEAAGHDGSGNVVLLRGKVSTPPEERALPSGTSIVTLRLSIARETSPMTEGSRQTADWVDCAAWGRKVRRTVSRWRAGDVVEVEGAAAASLLPGRVRHGDPAGGRAALRAARGPG